MSERPRRKYARPATAAIAAVVALVWALAGSAPPPVAEQFERAERILRDRFDLWRARAEAASARLASLAAAARADPRRGFEGARRIVAETGVDGVALLDRDGHARCWAGRTFDTDPAIDFYDVREGADVVRILDQPAHPLLCAARAAGPEIAVSFLAFEERIPGRRKLAEEVARAAGLREVRLRFGSRAMPVSENAPGDRKVVVLPSLVHATLIAHKDKQRERLRTAATNARLRRLAFLLAAFVALGVRMRLRRRAGPLLTVALLAGLRLLLAALELPGTELFGRGARLWGGPGDSALSAFVLIVAAIAAARAAGGVGAGRARRTLGVLAIAACAAAPRLYAAMLGRLVEGTVLFDPLEVWPNAPAALALLAACLATGALFLLGRTAFELVRGERRLEVLPFAALALGALPWTGPWLALTSAAAALILRRGATRPEKAAALTVLAALAAFPLLYRAHRESFIRDTARRAGELVRRTYAREVQERLERAVESITDPEEGADRAAAQVLAEQRPAKHLAFKLWAAARWDASEPCSVQVWDAEGKLASAFDYDSPPAGWLPRAPPPAARPGTLTLTGEGKGEAINYYVRELELRTIGDERRVGVARIVVPDRWDLLLSPLRPSMFHEPRDVLGRGTARPALVAELSPDGYACAASTGITTDLQSIDPPLLREARAKGWAGARIPFRGHDALLVLAPGPYTFAALLFDDALLEQAGFVFSRLMLTFAAVCAIYVLGLLLANRGRVQLLFRHRVGIALALLSLPPVYVLGVYNRRSAERGHTEAVSDLLQRRLDLAETLLRERKEEVDDAWCASVASHHLVDLNVYRGAELVATSRPGVWDTGLLGRRLAAEPFMALELGRRVDYTGAESFGPDAWIQAAYRRIERGPGGEPLILAAPALEDRRAMERLTNQRDALLLAIYLLTATVTVFVALLLGRSLTQPVQSLREATSRVAAGELDTVLPEGRPDEFGDLVRAFNRMTRELREAQDLRVRAEKAAAWREMARQIAHEIKNPLTPIKLTVQNLLAAHREDPEGFDQEFERGSKLILDQIDALYRIAGAFSAYARFPSRHLAPLDLAELAAEVADLYAAAGGSEVAAEREHDVPLVVRADHDELRRVLINLVTNSRQAGARRVTLHTAHERDRARLDVVDDGAGIPPEVRERIFEPSFTTKTSGTGLGMPIVKRIIDDYGGTIELTGSERGGTTVTLRLPLAKQDARQGT